MVRKHAALGRCLKPDDIEALWAYVVAVGSEVVRVRDSPGRNAAGIDARSAEGVALDDGDLVIATETPPSLMRRLAHSS
jgi:hypothetical protein